MGDTNGFGRYSAINCQAAANEQSVAILPEWTGEGVAIRNPMTQHEASMTGSPLWHYPR